MPNWIPIEDTGMSIISALFFFFGGSSVAVFGGIVLKRLDKHDDVLDDHKEAINGTNIKLTRIEGNVDTTMQIVQRMETNVSEMGKTYAGFIERLLDNKNGRAD